MWAPESRVCVKGVAQTHKHPDFFVFASMGCGLWAVGCGLWAVGCGQVGCGLSGLWAVGRGTPHRQGIARGGGGGGEEATPFEPNCQSR